MRHLLLKNQIKNVLVYFVLLIVSIISLFPIFWTILASFKYTTDIFLIPPVWIFKPTLENYIAVFERQPFLKYMFNSFITAGVATLLSTVLGILAGYSFARFRFPGKNILFFGILITRMFPLMAILIPLYIQFWKYNMLDTHMALILVYTARCVGYATWMMEGIFLTIPREMEESAMIDGCSRLGALIRVILPIAKAGLASFIILNYIYLWNDFLIAAILTGNNARTLPVAITSFFAEFKFEWGPACAGSTIVMLPPIIMAFLFSRHIIKGMIMGAVKG
jgi:multiple sugar transport system permease protein